MAIRKVIVEGDPLLRRRAEEVTAAELASAEFRRLVEDMVETMYAERGVGLAAPQVGIGKRVFVAEGPHGSVALVNPIFSAKSWKMTKDEEGCLSVPGQYGKVLRHKSLRVKALTINGEELDFKAGGFFARILQHENDHLDGILFIDRIAEQKTSSR